MNARVSYMKGELSKERAKLLKGIPGVRQRWDDPDNHNFTANVKKLKKFVQKFKRLPIRADARPKEAQLANFMNDKKTLYNNGKLSEQRLKLLVGVPRMWERMKSRYGKKA